MSDPIFSSPLINPLGFNDLGEAPLSDIYPNVFYAVQSAGATSALFLVDITTGEKTLIPGGTLAFATFAIARDSNTGRVYYVGTQNNGSAPVAYWDPATQTNTVLPNPTGQSVQFLKLAQAQDGTIYGLGSTANLYSINPTTGVATNLGAITGGSPAFTGGGGDAAFDPNDSNTLYVSVVAGGQLRLYAVNVTTRVATYVGQSGLSSVTNSGALAFGEDGELYGVVTAGGGTSFVRLSRTNGLVSAVIKSNSEAYSDFSSLPTPTPDVDFTIVKTDGVDSIVSGANTTYTISLTNRLLRNINCELK
jgi:dipeptidyl aminopeptidase/acylaminoacyl peptidase